MNKEVFKQKVYNKYEIEQRKNKNKNQYHKIIQIASTIIITLAGTTGMVFAGVKIYNEYIKKQDIVTSRGLFDTGDGITTYETDLMANDMTWNEKSRIYHRIITNMDDYNKYKSRISQLPDMKEEDFNESFLVILANENIREDIEKDLVISEVTADDTTTHITMKQKENPNYNIENNIWYAIVDKSQLRENIDVKIENKNIKLDKFVDIKELPKDYSVQEAINDKCFVVDKNEVLSDNENQIDEFIEKTKNGETTSIRVYIKYDDEVTIKDIKFENGLYYEYTDATRTEYANTYNHSYRYLIKNRYKNSDGSGYGLTDYIWTNDDISKGGATGSALVMIKEKDVEAK